MSTKCNLNFRCWFWPSVLWAEQDEPRVVYRDDWKVQSKQYQKWKRSLQLWIGSWDLTHAFCLTVAFYISLNMWYEYSWAILMKYATQLFSCACRFSTWFLKNAVGMLLNCRLFYSLWWIECSVSRYNNQEIFLFLCTCTCLPDIITLKS